MTQKVTWIDNLNAICNSCCTRYCKCVQSIAPRSVPACYFPHNVHITVQRSFRSWRFRRKTSNTENSAHDDSARRKLWTQIIPHPQWSLHDSFTNWYIYLKNSISFRAYDYKVNKKVISEVNLHAKKRKMLMSKPKNHEFLKSFQCGQ